MILWMHHGHMFASMFACGVSLVEGACPKPVDCGICFYSDLWGWGAQQQYVVAFNDAYPTGQAVRQKEDNKIREQKFANRA